jgi:hypothetical protein
MGTERNMLYAGLGIPSFWSSLVDVTPSETDATSTAIRLGKSWDDVDFGSDGGAGSSDAAVAEKLTEPALING